MVSAGAGYGFGKLMGKLGQQVDNVCTINSFSAETEVETSEGEKPISEIRLGDQVLAYNTVTSTNDYYTVDGVISHVDQTVIELTLDTETLTTTLEHPFYTLEDGWQKVSQLEPGEHVRKADGSYGVVQSVVVVDDPQRMYNLSVEQAHSFFVGDDAWLVHNACRLDPSILPDYNGGRTTGILDTGFEQIRLVSGKYGPSASMPKNTPGMRIDMAVRTHVEAHSASIMRQQQLSEATLYINRHPCSGDFGCGVMLPHMLPENSKLHVYLKEGKSWSFVGTYTGLPDADFDWSVLKPR